MALQLKFCFLMLNISFLFSALLSLCVHVDNECL